MNWADVNLFPALPEIVLLAALGVVLVVDLFVSEQNRWVTWLLTLLAVVVVFVTQLYVGVRPTEAAFSLGYSEQTPLAFFINDGMAQLAKLGMYLILLVLLVYSRLYIRFRDIAKGEYFTLMLFALLGMNMMVSARHFLLLYVGLELLALALCALIALRRDDSRASEAALKYFVLSAVASGLLLYGISMIYGATGSLYFQTVLESVHDGKANNILIILGMIFIVVAVAFKFGAAPFHMWVPDVYEGSPTAVAFFVGTLPKIAAVVFAFRLLVMGLGGEFPQWKMMLVILAVASLVVGNLAAIMQTNIKRMLGYSTVAHMGFILLGFAGGRVGFDAAMYYSITYALMAAAAFGVLMALSSENFDCTQLSDLAGLNKNHPLLAGIMLLAMFSMAGIPPLMGFYAKFWVISALLSQQLIWVAVVAVVMSLIGAFYYLRVVKVMYFDEPTIAHANHLEIDGKIYLAANALLLLAWGVLPQQVVNWVDQALKATL